MEDTGYEVRGENLFCLQMQCLYTVILDGYDDDDDDDVVIRRVTLESKNQCHLTGEKRSISSRRKKNTLFLPLFATAEH